MKIKVSLSDEQVKKYLGNISPDEFRDFCKDAIISKLFEKQFLAKDNQAEE